MLVSPHSEYYIQFCHEMWRNFQKRRIMMVRKPKSLQVNRKFYSFIWWWGTNKETIRIIFKPMKIHHGLEYFVWPQGNNISKWKVQGNRLLSQHTGQWDAWKSLNKSVRLYDHLLGMFQRRVWGITWVVEIDYLYVSF